MSLVNSTANTNTGTRDTSTEAPAQTNQTPTPVTPSPETRVQTSGNSATPSSTPVTVTVPSDSAHASTSTSITTVPGNGSSNTVLQVNSSASSPNTNGGADTATSGTPATNANSATTVIITVNSGSGDYDGSSEVTRVDVGDQGIGIGSIIGIVVGTVLLVLLIVGLAFYLYRRQRHKSTPHLPSVDDSYSLAPGTFPVAEPVLRASRTPSSEIDDQDTNNFNRTVDLDSTGHLDSTLRGELVSKENVNLWEDETILAARIPMEKVVRMELMNEGGHGVVYHGQYRGERVAIKLLLRFVGVAWDALSDLCAVSEFMPCGDLFSLLRRFHRVDQRPQGFDEDKAKIAQHIAQALTYLHSLDPIVLHRDLKSMNVLLSENWDAKLTDFGVSRKWTVDTMTAGVGTRRWMAPEVMMGRHYDTSADVFSFGVVLSELDSHQPPYANAVLSMTSESGKKVTENALAEMVATGRIRIEFSPNAPAALVLLGHACVNLDPRARPSASEVHYQLEMIMRKYQKYTL